VIVRFRCITVILFLFALLFSLNSKAQDSVVLNVPYTIKTDTITRIDTTYVIDTIIKPVQYIKIDTIFFQSDHDTVTKAKTKKELQKEAISHKFEGNIGLTLNQLAITHWAAGGESNSSGKANFNFKYTYNRRLFNYVISGVFGYGLSTYARDKRVEKTEDRCEISTTMSHNNKKNLTFTSIGALKTQFAKGYTYPNDSVPISGFFAPAYLTISVGYTYSFKGIASIFISPVAGKLTFVNDQKLADEGAFGVEAGYWNIVEGDSIWIPGKRFLSEIGINILIKYKQDFGEKFSIFSNLNLYNNYMDHNKSNRWNIDVDWETGIRFLISKQISTVINIHLIYDDNIKFTVTEIENGVEITKQRPILQFKESLGISFLYKFATK